MKPCLRACMLVPAAVISSHSLLSGYSTGLHGPLEKIAEAGKGILLFMRPHQDANDILAGLRLLKSRVQDGKQMAPPEMRSEEQRDFGIGAQILRDLGVSKLLGAQQLP